MRNKLQKFTAFANTLLPHETKYLLSIQKMEDKKKLEILKRVDFNCQNIGQFTPYDTNIDKRKYSLLKKWINERLAAIDVDGHFNWLSGMERKITTDSIQLQEEKKLLKYIRQYEYPSFYFSKLYELAEQYRHFLLIRMRYNDHGTVNDFLKKNKDNYIRSKSVNKKLHEATRDIVRQYSENISESMQWEKWLTHIFYDKNLDGHNRYMALVRLAFISFNYRKFDMLRDKLDFLDGQFAAGQYYSRRLLLNYYNNRLMLHARFREYEKAINYGYLAIRGKTHDYLLYVNNLSALLLREKKEDEALSVLRHASAEMKASKNFHNKTGYVAFYVTALNAKGQYKNARNYAEVFLMAYKKEILRYRWHLFFSAYLETLLHLHEHALILRLVNKYKLLEKDKAYRNRANYLPTIVWYAATAKYLSGGILKKELKGIIQPFVNGLSGDKGRLPRVKGLLKTLGKYIPEVVGYLKLK